MNKHKIDGVHGPCIAEVPLVLDQGFVQLIDMMPHPSTLEEGYPASFAAVEAARTSFLGEMTTYERDLQLLNYLIEHDHTSTLEQIEMKFRVKAPVVVFWQWVRHRLFSYNLSSGRYINFEDELYVPNQWRLQSEENKQGSDGVLTGKESDILTDRLIGFYEYSMRLYNDALDMGIAKEQARLFTPGWSLYYTAVVKGNVRTLINFMKLRMDDHAQWEVRQYANAVCDLAYLYIPEIIEIYQDSGALPAEY